MKFLKLFGWLILYPIILNAQEFSTEFGNISNYEIELINYKKDTTAEAVVIFDIGNSEFIQTDNSFDVLYERKTRIKIFSEAGLKWAEIEIPFYQEGDIFEKVTIIEANTYNFENGRLIKTPLNIANCYNEKTNEFWNKKKFVMPEVKVGSIIEYKYKIYSQYIFNLRDWEFQWKIPTIYSEYNVKTIPFYEYMWLLQGSSKFDSQVSKLDNGFSRQFGPSKYRDMLNKFIMKDIPAFNDETYITSINDNIIKLDFQLCKITQLDGSTKNIISTWPELINDLIKDDDFGKFLKKSEKLAHKLINLDSLSLFTQIEKFNYILNYVKENYSWNKTNSKYSSNSPSDLVKDKYGNSAEINLFTIGLLNAFGIQASPVLISTRDNGKIKYDYPFSHFFNYVLILVNIDNKNILSDATERFISNDRIPARCINDKGLLIQKDKVEWIGLQSSFYSKQNTSFLLDFTLSDVNANIKKTFTEYDAFNYRNLYAENSNKIKDYLNKKDYDVIDSSINIINYSNIEKPYILKFKLLYKPDFINDKIYLSPFLNESIAENPLKQNSRSNPIDMNYQTSRVYNSTIIIPQGYKIDFIPLDNKINDDLFDLDYNVKIIDNKINISFYYAFKKSIYSANDYLKIKSYFDEIVKKGNEKIVLSKL